MSSIAPDPEAELAVLRDEVVRWGIGTPSARLLARYTLHALALRLRDCPVAATPPAAQDALDFLHRMRRQRAPRRRTR